MSIYVWRESSPGTATESAVSLLNLGGGEKDDYDGGKGYDQRGNKNRWGAARKS
jgi:hypothetical protein